jgi:Domain of unknown function (DUF4111)
VPPAAIPHDVQTACDAVDAAVRGVAGDRAVSTYVHGSVVLGGFDRSVSDVDLLIVVDDQPRLTSVELQILGERIVALPAPGQGLELSIVDAAAAAEPGEPWPFLLHATTAPRQTKVILGEQHGGDRDLLMHYVVVRAAGAVIRGESAEQVIGASNPGDVLAYLADELAWAETHAPEAYGVLNAARAWRFLQDGSVVSKLDGARVGVEAGAPAWLITRAIEAQSGGGHSGPPDPDAVAFMRKVRAELEAAADQ